MNAPYQRVQVIINPASGGDEPILNTMNDIFNEFAMDWDVSITRKAGDGARFAKLAVEQGVDAVLAYGGDGTQLDVAGGMLNTGIPMGVLPGGTANALADELGLPDTLADALRVICEPHRLRTIDAGKIGDRYFLLRIGSGVIARFHEEVNREMKDRFGIAAYIVGAVQAMREPRYGKYILTIDDQRIETEGIACMVSNGNAIGALGIRLAPEIMIDDGLLNVYVLNSDLQTVLGIMGSISGREDMPLQQWRGKTIHIEADPPQKIYADGEEEPAAETPCTIETLAGALKVIVTEGEMFDDA
ncbi:MAG: diacylglycerol kinase family lipid kinase [Anaerolineae bacterium]|nr:diacylglycerol kinase family lipid kinase [Anaerolineae bacterium]MCA9894619.1 diacylglycerol kinase family lipid kinase [Anaerolineae bacterium]